MKYITYEIPLGQWASRVQYEIHKHSFHVHQFHTLESPHSLHLSPPQVPEIIINTHTHSLSISSLNVFNNA